MSLIALEGFDNYGQSSDLYRRAGEVQWSGPSNGVANGGTVNIYTVTTLGRGGYGKCLSFSPLNAFQYGELTAGLSQSLPKLTMGFAVQPPGSQPEPYDFILRILVTDGTVAPNSAQTSVGNGVQLVWDLDFTACAIRLYLPTSTGLTLLGTALNVLQPTIWSFVELQMTIGNGNGTAAVRVNGRQLPSFPDLTGITTQTTSNSSLSSVSFTSNNAGGLGWNQQGPLVLIDDMYFVDNVVTPGPLPSNSFMGDTRCSTQFPIGQGVVNWTPLTGENWQNVDNPSFDGDTTYNYSNAAGATDLFVVNPLVQAVGWVLGVSVTIAVRSTDATAALIAPVIYIGSKTYVGTGQAVDVSYLFITGIWPLNPATNQPWQTADVNSAQFGYVIVN